MKKDWLFAYFQFIRNSSLFEETKLKMINLVEFEQMKLTLQQCGHRYYYTVAIPCLAQIPKLLYLQPFLNAMKDTSKPKVSEGKGKGTREVFGVEIENEGCLNKQKVQGGSCE